MVYGSREYLKRSWAFAFPGIELQEAFEVIRWYQYFIPAKIGRALYEFLQKDDLLQDDADGSA
ncbi:MAG: hypothetical protein ACUVWV_00555 [Thermodesulfobacteriota bacterium]